jgi:hypothetical protein
MVARALCIYSHHDGDIGGVNTSTSQAGSNLTPSKLAGCPTRYYSHLRVIQAGLDICVSPLVTNYALPLLGLWPEL